MKGLLRVALVCSFSNARVRDHLPLSNLKLYRFCRRMLGLPTKVGDYGDIAGWNSYTIELLRRRKDIELHVISAHSGLRRAISSFEMDGVHYNFVRIELGTLLKHLIVSPSLWHKLNPVRPVVRRIVKRIKPDVIVLIGAENAHISGTVIGIKDIPLFVKCQTIYNNPERAKRGRIDAINAYVERIIFQGLKYVSAEPGMFCHLFRNFNKDAINLEWPLENMLPEVKPLKKEYDFVNFAMAMIPEKGYPDAIHALAIVKKEYPGVRLNLVGGGSKEGILALQNLVAELHLEGNVIFTPFFKKQEDLFQHLQKSRFAVLPCKIDSIASTIRQAMHYGLPVVCYKTEGTPTLNQDKECVLIAEKGNVNELAAKMLSLLSDQDKAMELQRNAKDYSQRWNDDETNLRQMTEVLNAVVDNYYYGISVPECLLYNEN